MTKKPYYETMYILRPDIPEEEVENHVKKYSDLLTKAGAEVLDSQMRGKRRLAYPISKHKEGIYVQLSHNGDGQHIEVLEKAMRLGDDVIRYLTVKQEGPLPTPRVSPSNEEAKEKESTKEDKDTKNSADEQESKDIPEDKENKDSESPKDDESSAEKDQSN